MTDLVRNYFSPERAAALLSWFFVAASCLYFIHQSDNYSLQTLLLAAVLFATFIVSFMMAIREDDYANDHAVRLTVLVISLIACISLYFTVPYTFIAILMVMWIGQLPYYMSMRAAVLISPLFAAPLYFIYTYYWKFDGIAISALLFWTFNLFSLAMIGMTKKAEEAKDKADELNRELMATQALLGEATKQAERVRIARNIHDLLGHHLTALTINLQVASRVSEGQAKEKIDECHSLSKLLLSDVREAVSEIREKSSLELKTALHRLIENVPKIDIKMDYADNVKVDDVQLAETILRCVQESITNCLKHSNADRFNVSIVNESGTLLLTMTDNGDNKSAFSKGNGLSGISERLSLVGGSVKFDQSNRGFVTHIQIPEYS